MKDEFKLPPFATIFPLGKETSPDFIRENLGQWMNNAGLNPHLAEDRARFKNKIFAEHVPTEWVTRSNENETLLRLLNTLRGWTPALASIKTPEETVRSHEPKSDHVRSDQKAFEDERRGRGRKKTRHIRKKFRENE